MDKPGEPEEHVVSDMYEGYQSVQQELLLIKAKKTRNTLLILAVVIWASEFLALTVAGLVMANTILIISVIPAIIAGMGFLAMKEPLVAAIVSALLIAGAWIYVASIGGVATLLQGWLVKTIIIFLIISSFQHAAEHHRVRRELKNS